MAAPLADPPVALLAPGFHTLATTTEGQCITPVVLGRRLELNAVFVFANVIFCAWTWGFAGALTAVRFLVCRKVPCDSVPALSTFGNVLGISEFRGRYDPLRGAGGRRDTRARREPAGPAGR